MKDFWISCGHHLLDRDDDGRLVVTDPFLKAYIARPELRPPAEACAAERALHAALMADPRRSVAPDEIAAIGDEDARENWQLVLAFRDLLLSAPNLEAAYLRLAREGAGAIAPIFLNQLTHVVLRNALDGCEDPFTLRAAELFFRTQKATVHEGALLLADAETVQMHEEGRGASPLITMFHGPAVHELDVLDDANSGQYFERSDAFDFVLNLGAEPRARIGLARAVEAWVRHLMATEITVEPVSAIHDQAWQWFVGLDQEATRIGNKLWNGVAPDQEELDRILALFRARSGETSALPEFPEGWLFLAMTRDNLVRLKPQNIIAGLPAIASGIAQ